MKMLCQISDVQRVFDTSGRFDDAEIKDEIVLQSDAVYFECGYPLAATNTLISVNNDTSADDFRLHYYLGEQRISYVERVFIGTTSKREITETTDFDVAKNVGMIKLTSSTVAGTRLDSSDDMIVYYVPSLYTRYCALRVAEALLERTDTLVSGAASKELLVVRRRLEQQEKLINQRIGVVFSSQNRNYDEVYGINMKKIVQNFDKNAYLYRADSIDD